MLVGPLIRRHNDAAGFPIDSLHRLPIRPENRVALAAQYNDVRAGSVLMPFLVSTDGELRDMRAHGLLGEIELHIRAALATLAVVGKADGVRVRHEARRHEEA